MRHRRTARTRRLRSRHRTSVDSTGSGYGRGDRSDRSFILGGSGHPEEPYTWESPVHQGHHSRRDNSTREKSRNPPNYFDLKKSDCPGGG